ncbi:MAG: hypothetical protein M0P57_06805 [Syntrophales bacterium]|jgi:pilus assembly protein CpaE|nr:hypothetical protein [Syntrophales bacterium]MDY0043613.1 hypothetical protein [Syntrophales bacterium]
MTEDTLFAKIETKGKSLAKQLERVLREFEEIKLQEPGDLSSPDLFILDVGEDPEGELDRFRPLLQSSLKNEVFITSAVSESQIILMAMRAGAKEFLPQPIDEEDFKHAIAGFIARREQACTGEEVGRGRIINVMGGKGGAGATTIAVNLALAVAMRDSLSKVVLFDMHKRLGEIPVFLSFKPAFDWSEITKDIDRLDDTFLMNILYKHSSGAYVLPAPARMNNYMPLMPDTLDLLMDKMQRLFDIVVVDSGNPLEDTACKLFERAWTNLMISTPSMPYVVTAGRILASLKSAGYRSDSAKIVVNRITKHPEVPLSDVETYLSAPIFWSVPNDYKTVSASINRGAAIVQEAAKSAVAKNIQGLADALLHGEKKRKKKWLFK